MSINVTVTGNPVSIKRGKMVTSDSYQAKKEFEKRRLMRLEQVRQQSKDIAADVRDKVRREKKKQIRQIEEEGKEKLKNWQNRRLLQLQNQYEEALHELGTGHKEAINFENEAEILEEQKDHCIKVATHRGQVAATKLQIEKNQENLKKAIPIQQKKLVRDIENTRASLISGIRKKGKKGGSTETTTDNSHKTKKTVADINITIPSLDSDSDIPVISPVTDMEFSSDHDKLSHVGEKAEHSTSSCDCIDISNPSPRQPLGHKQCGFGSDSGLKSLDPTMQKNEEQTTTGTTNFAKKIYERRRLVEEFLQKQSNVSPPRDTRISERIKRRELMTSQPDYCDIVAKTHPTPFIESNTQLRDAIDAHNINNAPVEINCICGHKCPKVCGSKSRNQQEKTQDKLKFNENNVMTKQGKSRMSQESTKEKEIPEKPPVKLKDNYGSEKILTGPSKVTVDSTDTQKVSFYDHPTKFIQEKPIPSNVHVEKITTDSLEVNPNVVSETEWLEKMKQRDKEAKIRGQKALEKERIQKDYEEMLKKLPLLQKKERICEITKDKQEYHMSEERLKERERKKQNDLDNAYAKLFPNLKPAVVTLPVKNHGKQGNISPDGEPIQSLNVGSWDVDQVEPKMFTAEEVQEIVKAFTEQKPQERRTKLKQLLKSLKLQKEQLINEIKSLPSNDSINELISDLRSFSDSDEKCGRSRRKSGKSERKRRREEQEKETTDSTTEDSSTSSSKHEKEKKVRGRGNGKTPLPRKKQKIRSKRRVLVLQNMSTQTTPKASSNSEQNKIVSKDDKVSDHGEPKTQALSSDKDKPICRKLHIPCDCNKENESTEELCQIVIKINENEEPEVVVKSKEKDVKIQDIVKEKSPKHKKPELISVAVGTEELKQSKTDKTVDRKTTSDPSEIKTSDKPKKVSIKKHRTDPKPSRPHEVDSSEFKAKSWSEQLSKNSVSTTSTSYFSPPDFQKPKSSTLSSINDPLKQSLYNLRKKPQQNNLSVSPSQTSVEQPITDPKLLPYIQKLLSMSRGSVENLTVSTSSIQTPSQSVIELESNNPLAQLHNVIKYINLKDIRSNLSYSPDYSPIHPNTSASTSHGSQREPTQEKTGDVAVDSKSKTDQSSRIAAEKEITSGSARSKDSVLAQYAEITDSCSKRIAQLASMIEQIREEKIQMLQNPPTPDEADKAVTDKDYSTAYMELPGSNDGSSKYSSLNSLDDEELQKKLLEIDFSLAEKLRRLNSNKQNKRSDENPNDKEKAGPSKDIPGEGNTNSELWWRLNRLMQQQENILDEANDTNSEIWSRLSRLMQQQEQPGPKTSSVAAQSSIENVSFVPFLSDIPKLPKLEPQPEHSNSNHKHPPPSKGLSVAKKFNGNISLVPHELSTIVEADSQMSTKMGSANNSRTSQDISPRKDFELIVQPELRIEEENSNSKSSSKSDKSSPGQLTKVSITAKSKSSEAGTTVVPSEKSKEKDVIVKSKMTLTSSPNHSSESSSQSVVLTSSKSSSSKKSVTLSNSSDDMEVIESMLRSIGMEWAIPTLHKTKEALALASSSSSLELSSKKQLTGNTSSGSEISLKQYLKKQIKISSSTLKSDASPASFSGDLSELSSIQVSTSNLEKSHKRTSTPIVSSKSTEKSSKKVIFTGDSDISSVKDDSRKHSDKSNINSYRSLSEYYSQSNSDI